MQLPWAGIEPYVEVIRAHADRTWTCGKGVYAEPVAELALTLLLAGKRGLGTYGRATVVGEAAGRNLLGARVVVLGGGGITESFLRLIGPFGADVTVVRRNAGAAWTAPRVVGADAARRRPRRRRRRRPGPRPHARDHRRARPPPPRAAGRRRVGRERRPRRATSSPTTSSPPCGTGRLGGAGLDVTDPEPLPDGHPLWSLPNVLITPHVGNTPAMAVPLLSARVTENVRRWSAGEELLGPVDPAAGY